MTVKHPAKLVDGAQCAVVAGTHAGRSGRSRLGRGMTALREVRATVISVKVKPNSRVSVLAQVEGGTWLAQLKSAPVDGKANEELLALVARHFGCRKSAVSLKSGASARIKLVRIEGPSALIKDLS